VSYGPEVASEVSIRPLVKADLQAARDVLSEGCAFDRAGEVAEEKLFGPAPGGAAVAWAAESDVGILGVAAVTADRLRILAVRPGARGRGVGSALLEHAERAVKDGGGTRLRTLDLPGNYLSPGIDVRNSDTIAWFEKRGWQRARELTNVLIDVRNNPRVRAPSPVPGYQLRRATDDDGAALAAAIAAEFPGGWPFEMTRALTVGGVHVAIAEDGTYAAFACHDGNNQGLGWFGPAGTWPAHRGKGLGEALLLACLLDVKKAHDVCEVAWVGPRAFYEKAVGVAGERRFVVLQKDL
jgi:mycothiol synthase